MQRFRPKCGKQGTDNATLLERSQHRDIKLRNPSGKYEYRFPRLHTDPAQHVCKAIAQFIEFSVAEITPGTIFSEPAYCKMTGAQAPRMAGNRFMGDIDPPAIG